MKITPPRMRRLYQLLTQTGQLGYKHTLCYEISNGRTESSSELTDDEAIQLINQLESKLKQTAVIDTQRADKMRKKIISMAREMRWEYIPSGAPLYPGSLKADMRRINEWCIKWGYLHKPLNAYSYQELTQLVTQFEQVYRSYLKSI